jgi:hypothetical protein
VSIGWHPTGPVECTVCNADWTQCWHYPGQKLAEITDADGKKKYMPSRSGSTLVEWRYTSADLVEVSAVPVPAVKDAEIQTQLAAVGLQIPTEAPTLAVVASVAAIAAGTAARQAAFVAEQHRYLDSLPPVAARAIAERNRTSLGNWGESWLAANPAELPARALSAGEFLDRLEADHARKLQAYMEGLAAYETANPGGDYLATDDGRAKYRAVCAARDELMEPSTSIAAEFADERAAANAALDRAVDSFALQHNMTPALASERLYDVAPKLFAQLADIDTRHRARRTEIVAALQSRRWGRAQEEQNKRIADTAKPKLSELPAEKALREHVETLAAQRKTDYLVALDWAMQNDTTTKALYRVYADEQNRRAARGGE